MPTLNDAARQLAISEKTLRKWMKRLEMKPARHDYDWRFYVLSDEQVQQIKDARAQMPGSRPAIIPSYSSLAFDRRQSDAGTASDASPSVAPTPRQRPLQRAAVGALPDGMMAKEDASRLHGVPTATLRRWCAEGKIETHSASYAGEHGRYGVVNPITQRGLAQFYALASHRADFRRCDDCPHDEASTGQLIKPIADVD